MPERLHLLGGRTLRGDSLVRSRVRLRLQLRRGGKREDTFLLLFTNFVLPFVFYGLAFPLTFFLFLGKIVSDPR